MPARVIRYWIWLAALLLAGPLDAFQWRLAPAWQGRFLPGQTSELSARITGLDAGPVSLHARSGSWHGQMKAEADGRATLTLTLPLQVDPDGRITVELRRSQQLLASQELTLQPLPAPLDLTRLPVRGEDLPKTPQGYGPIDALRLNALQLRTLDDAQLAALQDFIGRCGQVEIVDADPALQSELARLSACGPARLPRPAPNTRLLIDLAESASSAWPLWPALILGSYLLGLWWVGGNKNTVSMSLGLSLLSTAGLLVIAQARAPTLTQWSWLETRAGQVQANAWLVTRISGDGLRPASLELPAGFQPLPDPDAPLNPDTHYQAGGSGLSITLPWFSRAELMTRGVSPLALATALTVAGDQVALRNPGKDGLPAGLLVTSQSLLTVPELPAGASWTPTANGQVVDQPRLARLVRQRLGEDRAAWLLPLERLPTDRDKVGPWRHGWLMIRPGRTGGGSS